MPHSSLNLYPIGLKIGASDAHLNSVPMRTVSKCGEIFCKILRSSLNSYLIGLQIEASEAPLNSEWNMSLVEQNPPGFDLCRTLLGVCLCTFAHRSQVTRPAVHLVHL